MAQLHYIWWGPVPDSQSLSGVNEVARRYGGSIQIKMWVLSEHAAGFGSALNASVTVVGMSDQLLCAQVSDAKTRLGKLYADTVATVKFLTANKAYSAVKDVLMLYILYLVGGVYLDTTTAPITDRGMLRRYEAQPTDVGVKEAELGIHLLGVAFAEIGFGGYRDFEEGCTPGNIDTLSTKKFYTPSVDFWAAWAAPRNAIVLAALAHYVAFVKGLPSGVLATSKRDGVIGDLITLSVQRALIDHLVSYYPQGSLAKDSQRFEAAAFLKKHMWPAKTLTNEDYEELHANFMLPTLGILKWHKGTWRNQK